MDMPGMPLFAVWLDRPTLWLLGGVLGLLVVAMAVGQILKRQPNGAIDASIIHAFHNRLRTWWVMYAILATGMLWESRVPMVVLFGGVSFWALREFVTMTNTRRGDHRALFWTFFLFTPLQYALVGIGSRFKLDLYGLYSIMIPVYASLFIPARIALSGDQKRFLERSAKIQFGLLICVYSLSYAPALLDLKPKVFVDGAWVPWTGSNAGLLFYFILVTQLADVFQFAWGKLLGRHVIAPGINASRTWEGFIGGLLSTALAGMLLWKVTPFSLLGSAGMSAVIAVLGFAGSMTMSAIKRDRGVDDTGTLVQGHAGVLDRMDSICFAAPVFFHLTRFFYVVQPGP